MFEWLRKRFGIHRSTSLSKQESKEVDTSASNSKYDRLNEKEKNAKNEKKNLTQPSTDWYSIEIQQESVWQIPKIFHSRKWSEELLTLKSLKDERVKREEYELKLLEEKVLTSLKEAESSIAQGKAKEAKQSLYSLRDKIARIKDVNIRQRYIQAKNALTKLEDTLEQKRIAQLADEQRRKNEEARKRKEEQERIKKEQERQAEELRKKRQEEADKRAKEALKKAQTERAERQRLGELSAERKENWKDFEQVLVDNGIHYLYHFTDKRNIPSIKRHGGLFSWYYCMNNNINIPCQGGDSDSIVLDKKYGLQDYVRLSFCNDHPMAYRLEKSGSDIIVLRIKIDVALLKDTLFSDINAADKLHQHGGNLEDLKRVNFEATKKHYVSKDDKDFKPHQAEVMVKTFIPLRYIENI